MSRKCRKRRKNQPICRISAIFVSIAIILIAAFLFVKLDNAVRPSAQMQAETLSKHTAYEIITDTIIIATNIKSSIITTYTTRPYSKPSFSILLSVRTITEFVEATLSLTAPNPHEALLKTLPDLSSRKISVSLIQ